MLACQKKLKNTGLMPACHKKWMSIGLMLACHKNGGVPVLCQLVIKMDEYRSYAGLS